MPAPFINPDPTIPCLGCEGTPTPLRTPDGYAICLACAEELEAQLLADEPVPDGTIRVLIHLNIGFEADDVETAENLAWAYATEHGITDDVVYVEAE